MHERNVTRQITRISSVLTGEYREKDKPDGVGTTDPWVAPVHSCLEFFTKNYGEWHTDHHNTRDWDTDP